MNLYIGKARTEEDFISSIKLAAKIFRGEKNKEGIKQKKLIITQFDQIKFSLDNIIIIEINKKIIATCFIVIKEFYIINKIIRGAFLSSICVAEEYRNLGYSKKLLNYTFKILSDQNCKFAIVIARRAVDFYYNKFGFIGISIYSNIEIVKLNEHLYPKEIIYKFNDDPIDKDIEVIGEIYTMTYKNFSGPCIRDKFSWQYIIKRLSIEGGKLIKLLKSNRIVGYAILKDEIVHEIAVLNNYSYIPLLSKIKNLINNKNIILSIQQNHPLVSYLIYSDFLSHKRQCTYGGHMIKIIDKSTKNLNADNIYKTLGLSILSNSYRLKNTEYFDILYYDQF